MSDALVRERQMQRGKQWLEELLKLAKFNAKVQPQQLPDGQEANYHREEEEEPAECWLEIERSHLSAAQIQILLGADGTTLDAIQYLANAILNLGQEKDDQVSYTIELDGYRVRRLAELQALAEQAAQQVRQTGQEFEMKALSSAERRQVHTLLKDCEDLETYSRGQEPDRRLVVRLR